MDAEPPPQPRPPRPVNPEAPATRGGSPVVPFVAAAELRERYNAWRLHAGTQPPGPWTIQDVRERVRYAPSQDAAAGEAQRVNEEELAVRFTSPVVDQPLPLLVAQQPARVWPKLSRIPLCTDAPSPETWFLVAERTVLFEVALAGGQISLWDDGLVCVLQRDGTKVFGVHFLHPFMLVDLNALPHRAWRLHFDGPRSLLGFYVSRTARASVLPGLLGHLLPGTVPPAEPTIDVKLQFQRSMLYEAILPPSTDPARLPALDGLVPTLRGYQRRALAWMLRREGVRGANDAPDPPLRDPTLIELHPRRAGDRPLLYDLVDSCLRDPAAPDSSMDLALLRGGILAEEMGLGKTVEVLALVLAHERPPLGPPRWRDLLPPPGEEPSRAKTERRKSKVVDYSSFFFDDEDGGKRKRKRKRKRDDDDENDNDDDGDGDDKVKIQCICGQARPKGRIGEFRETVACSRCEVVMHGKCVGYRDQDPDDPNFLCIGCLNEVLVSGKRKLPTRATLIICPSSIIGQWEREIERHVSPGRLKVAVYQGVQQEIKRALGLCQPHILADHDVVLTTYEVLRGDFYRRQGDARGVVAPSSLFMLEWWRLCLDEAQMVESTASAPAKMAREMAAAIRWGVTGTPIQRSLGDLQGLFLFLGLSPVDRKAIWTRHVEQPYLTGCAGTHTSLHAFLRLIMWRNTKESVARELGLPSQTERVTTIPLSDIERIYYDDLLAKVRDDASTAVAHPTRKIPKTLHAAITSLRQACCQIVHNAHVRTLATTAKAEDGQERRFVSMTDMVVELVTKARVEVVEDLRHLVLVKHALAGASILRGNYDLAAVNYRSVLHADQERIGGQRIDLIQRAHAAYNLADILTAHGEEIAEREPVLDDSLTEMLRDFESEWLADRPLVVRQRLVEMEAKVDSNEPMMYHFLGDNVARRRRSDKAYDKVDDSLDTAAEYPHREELKAAWWLTALRTHFVDRESALLLAHLIREKYGKGVVAACFPSLAPPKMEEGDEEEEDEAVGDAGQDKDDGGGDAAVGKKKRKRVYEDQEDAHEDDPDWFIRTDDLLAEVHAMLSTRLGRVHSTRSEILGKLREFGRNEPSTYVDGLRDCKQCRAIAGRFGPLCAHCELQAQLLTYQRLLEQRAADGAGTTAVLVDRAGPKVRENARKVVQRTLEFADLERFLLAMAQALTVAPRLRQRAFKFFEHVRMLRTELAALWALFRAHSECVSQLEELSQGYMRLQQAAPDERISPHEETYRVHNPELVYLQNAHELTVVEAKLRQSRAHLAYLEQLKGTHDKVNADEADKDADGDASMADAPAADGGGNGNDDDDNDDDDDNKQCPICTDEYKLGQQVCMFPCGHRYCQKCTEQICKARPPGGLRCPTCRRSTQRSEIGTAVWNLGAKPGEGEPDAVVKTAAQMELRAQIGRAMRHRGSVTPGMGQHRTAWVERLPLPDGVTVAFDAGSKILTVVGHILRVVRADPDAKCLLFSEWRDVLSIFARALRAHGVQTIRFERGRRGGQQRCIERFDVDPELRVMLIDVRDGGQGLTLTMASHVFMVQPLMNPGVDAQCIARVHRIGQTRDTVVHRFLIENSVEEQIWRLLREQRHKEHDMRQRNKELDLQTIARLVL